MKDSLVSISPLEKERFGVVAARCPSTTEATLELALRFCRENGVDLLIARCDSTDYRAVHAIERAGGMLADTLVYWARGAASAPVPCEPNGVKIRSCRPDDATAVQTVAAEAFRGYLGHYHTDPRLDRRKADEAYADWAHRSCTSPSGGREVLVADWGGRIVGFLALCLDGPKEAEILLNGVLPEAQGMGVCRRLLTESVAWAHLQGVTRLSVSTQVTNVRAQRTWLRAGFAPCEARYTFHLWFS